MREVMEETGNLSDDDESPWHEKSEDEMRLALDMNATAFKQIMGLLQFDRYETVVSLIQILGEAMRQKAPAEPSDDESVELETYEERVRRYNNCGTSEGSDPDLWQEEIHFGPRVETPPNTSGLMEI